jgi:phospholipid-binding lipoprotein MlaA
VKIAASPRGALRRAAGLVLAALVAGCATPPSEPAERAAFEQNHDPLEPLNRQILDLNLFVDRILLKPATKVYIAVIPEELRDAVRRALDNMKEPVVVINNVLQGEPERAGVSVGRFAVNTTLGIAGLIDIAAKMGLEKESGDFGQTLFVWGLPQGPYLIVPLLGPSSPRDLIGMGADAYIDPFSFLATAKALDQIQIARFIVDGIDQRARVIDVLDDLEKNSLDFYAQLRSLAQQKRAAELRRGTAPDPGADLYQDPGKSPAATPGGTAPPAPPSPSPPSAGPPSASPTPDVPASALPTPPSPPSAGPPSAGPPSAGPPPSGPTSASRSPARPRANAAARPRSSRS